MHLLIVVLVCAVAASAYCVGPKCGPFPYTVTTYLNDQEGLVNFGPWPPSSQGYFTFAVEDPATPTFFEPVNEYGFPWPYPTISRNGLSQTGFSVTYPAFFPDLHDAQDAQPWNLKAQWFNDEKQTPPKTNVRCFPGRHPLVIHEPGAIQYDIDTAIITQKIVSWGWIGLSTMGTPGELSLASQLGTPYARHIIMQSKANALTYALLRLQQMSNDPDPTSLLHDRIDFTTLYYYSESLGGLLVICMENGCEDGYDVNKQAWPRFSAVRSWDPSADSYLNSTAYMGWNQQQVTVYSQFAGGQWGMDFRQWAQVVVGLNQVNSELFTKGTSHEQGAAINGCQNSNIAVKYGFYKNVTYWYGRPGVQGGSIGAAGIAANFWKFENQTAYRFCAPGNLSGFIDPKYPQMPLSTLVDILHLVDYKATTALHIGNQALFYQNFQRSHWEHLQDLYFEGQKHFLYWDNADVDQGNCTWDETDTKQKDAMTRENWVYLSYLSSTSEGDIEFQDSGTLHNYLTCYRCPNGIQSCSRCKFFCSNYTDASGNLHIVPVQPSKTW